MISIRLRDEDQWIMKKLKEKLKQQQHSHPHQRATISNTAKLVLMEGLK